MGESYQDLNVRKTVKICRFYTWNVKNNINKQNRNRFIDIENRLRLPEGTGVGRQSKKGERIKKYNLVVIK